MDKPRTATPAAKAPTLPLILVGLLLLGAGTWTSDFVTLQGERTVYTVECAQGQWRGPRCSGRLVPADRYRFRALKAHGEVLFWTAGASAPSGKLEGCRVDSGRDWQCPPNDGDGRRTITLQMLQGQPVRNPAWRLPAFHAVPKWRWYLLYWGLPAGSEAEQ